MEGKIEKFEDAFRKLNINRGNQHVKGSAPHQPCILLAVIEAIEQGAIDENVIRYEPRLLERFIPCNNDERKRGMYMMCSRARDYLFLVHGKNLLRDDAIAALPGPDVLERS